ncbi:polyprenol reductase-like [Anopheles merus]|uniref:polyprenol reductase-like n=1 Tax=Anopheles merus TaxID=30066 RepID=UPI001BE46E63|nr:polyprenol reductase-like [Anopheles merus]
MRPGHCGPFVSVSIGVVFINGGLFTFRCDIIRFPWFDIRSSFLFVNLIVTIVVLGGLLATIENHLPTAIRQTFRYDKHALKGSSDRLEPLLEILKVWFIHFYVFAALWSVAGFAVMM